MIFRFDDICANTDMQRVRDMVYIIKQQTDAIVQFAVSPIVNNVKQLRAPQNEFVFNPMYKAYSDYRHFFTVDRFAIPEPLGLCDEVLSHGLIHMDHQRLNMQAQEFSILISCSLLKTRVFVPPFNKWDRNTEKICIDNEIYLQKFEDGWRSIEYNDYDPRIQMWYLHSRNLSAAQLEKWFTCA